MFRRCEDCFATPEHFQNRVRRFPAGAREGLGYHGEASAPGGFMFTGKTPQLVEAPVHFVEERAGGKASVLAPGSRRYPGEQSQHF